MSLTEKYDATDKIEILSPFSTIQVRSATWVEKDGEIVGGKEYDRSVFNPGDTSDNAVVQAVINAVHTPEVIAAYEAHLSAKNAESEAQ